MPNMNKADIIHLSTLARMEITAAEVPALLEDISAVVAYISTITEVVGDSTRVTTHESVNNVFRSDVVTIPSGTYTKDLLAEAPMTERDFLVVKKILDTD